MKNPPKTRHVLWNWEKSPDSIELVRYHIIVADDKRREGTMESVLQQIQRVSSGIESIRRMEGKFAGTKLRYLFSSFDTPVSPIVINWFKTEKLVIQDKDLYERKTGSIEDYVINLYS
jgi:hypothetical protein